MPPDRYYKVHCYELNVTIKSFFIFFLAGYPYLRFNSNRAEQAKSFLVLSAYHG